jgi:uncharacterized protein (TIGR04222 family)
MTINPLDWTAGPFLLLYLAVAALSIAGILLVRAMLGRADAANDDVDLGILEIAWLSGGPARAADAVLLSLMTAGAATIDMTKRRVLFDASRTALPEDMEAFRDCFGDPQTRRAFHRSVGARLDPVRQALVQRGLAPGPGDLAWFNRATVILVLIPVLFGVAKIMVGTSRGRPVGFLVCLVIATAVCGICSLWPQPHRTRAGRVAVARFKALNARAARAPLGSEMALAFAISGPLALATTPYQTFFRGNASSGGDGGSGCGGGGGGGGGSGCGGCGSSG